jgi:predicted nucleic acid-binding protein
MIILDTNVFSALMTPRLDPAVERWLANAAWHEVYSTAITRAEIRYGIALLADGRRKSDLAARADQMFVDISRRLLPFDAAAADQYGVMVAYRRSIGRPISVQDALIASIARARRATVATRNTPDFEDCGVDLVNPWEAGATS